MEYNLVVPVFNRLQALQRLLHSLEQANYSRPVHLTLSMDGGASEEVQAFCRQYKWKAGKFEILDHQVNMGVDDHNLYCMRLALTKNHVIVLEDDLTVAPNYTLYLDAALSVTESDNKIAGVSLYRYPNVESYRFTFEPIPNDEFLYFQRRPSSKGCYYSRSMIEEFMNFLVGWDQDYDSIDLPPNVQKWSNEVWEKAYYSYMITRSKYLAFPRYSLSTDWGEPGVHMHRTTELFVHQSALYLGTMFHCVMRTAALNVYDQYYELDPDSMKAYLKELAELDVELDLRGTRDLSKIQSAYIISSRPCADPLRQWGRRLRPEVNNLLFNVAGNFYSLGKTSDFTERPFLESLKEDFLYYLPDTKLKDLLKMKWEEVKSRFI